MYALAAQRCLPDPPRGIADEPSYEGFTLNCGIRSTVATGKYTLLVASTDIAQCEMVLRSLVCGEGPPSKHRQPETCEELVTNSQSLA